MIGHPYKNIRVHNKHISCSQKLDNEQFEANLSEVRKKMEIITTQVFKQQTVVILVYKTQNCQAPPPLNVDLFLFVWL
jgi:hypothetical protein